MDDKTKCPFTSGFTNRDWWPDTLDLQVLHRRSPASDPMGEAFDYAKEFKSLDLNAVIKDLPGGRPTSATTAGCSSAWRGTARAPTASPTAAAAPAPDSSASHPS